MIERECKCASFDDKERLHCIDCNFLYINEPNRYGEIFKCHEEYNTWIGLLIIVRNSNEKKKKIKFIGFNKKRIW